MSNSVPLFHSIPQHEPSEPPRAKLIVKGTETPKLIPEASYTYKFGGRSFPGAPAPVPLPVECTDCTVKNVAIDVGIDFREAGELTMRLISPDNKEVLLVDRAEGAGFTSLSSKNLITFNDEPAEDPQDPQTLGLPFAPTAIVPSGTLYAQGSNPRGIGGDYPNIEGLQKLKGVEAKGKWIFEAVDNLFLLKGDIVVPIVESVKLEITCNEIETKACPSPESPAITAINVGGNAYVDEDGIVYKGDAEHLLSPNKVNKDGRDIFVR